ncbi:MAG: helix-turn-helix transcriptional regulator [Spirochaetes bacterium]|nr:helix-turn-helix transcriptional regulator [Spirochaetota bacterium]
MKPTVNTRARWAPSLARRAQVLKALAHPARLSILERLAKSRSCCCGDLVAGLPLAQATVSQHLAALKRAGLIQGTIAGPSVCYCIRAEAFRRALKDLEEYFALLGGKATAIEAACCPPHPTRRSSKGKRP